MFVSVINVKRITFAIGDNRLREYDAHVSNSNLSHDTMNVPLHLYRLPVTNDSLELSHTQKTA